MGLSDIQTQQAVTLSSFWIQCPWIMMSHHKHHDPCGVMLCLDHWLHFLWLSRKRRDVTENVKCLLFLSHFKQNCMWLLHCIGKLPYKNLTKILPKGNPAVACRQMSDRPKLIAAFRSLFTRARRVSDLGALCVMTVWKKSRMRNHNGSVCCVIGAFRIFSNVTGGGPSVKDSA
jgi:hypothetical protein